MTSKNKISLHNVSAALLASTLAVSVLSLSPTPTNIFSMSQANAQAVSIEAVQAPGFADVVEAVSPAVVSVRVEQTINGGDRNSRRGQYRFDRRDRDNDQGSLPKFFRDHPDFKEFFENRRGERSERGERGRRDDREFSDRSEGKRSKKRRGGNKRRSMSQGSGFFVSDDGYIVTNNHVIDNGSKFTIIMHDGVEHEAKLIGSDKRSDLAVLKIDDVEDKFTYVAFGEKDPRIGDWVVAVGNPFGLGGTVTSGIVSARGREIGANRYDDFIQIDAAVNKGNSGGPAFNLSGEVIGVNTAIFSPSGGNVGIAFAIPADTASEIVSELISNGKVVRGWLGVQIQPVTDDIAESLGLENSMGAIVAAAKETGPASKAGIKSGDVIISIDGKAVENPRELAKMVADYEPQSSVDVMVWRDGKEEKIPVNLGTLGETASAKSKETANEKARVGLALKAEEDGIRVVEVLPDSPADLKGIQAGDLVKSVNGEQIKEVSDVSKIVEQASELGRKAVLFQIDRVGSISFIAVPLKNNK